MKIYFKRFSLFVVLSLGLAFNINTNVQAEKAHKNVGYCLGFN
jgi:hypothetical protein